MSIINFIRSEKKIGTYLAIGLILILLIPIIADGAATNGKIRYGVKVGSISVGLLDEGQAKAKIEKALEGFADDPIVVKGKDGNWQLTPGEIKAKVNVDALVDRALKYGRKGSLPSILRDRILAWVRPYKIALNPSYDKDILDGFIATIVDEVNVEPIDATITMDGSDINISKSRSGVAVDKESLSSMIVNTMFAGGKRQIDLPKVDFKPFVNESELLAVKDQVLRVMKDPLTLKFEDQKLALKGDSLRDILTFLAVKDESRGEGGYFIKLGIDEDKLRDLLERKFIYEGERPKDATFVIEGDVVMVSPGSTGVGIDYVACISDIEKSFKGQAPRVVDLKIGEIEPRLTSEKAKKMGIEKLVSRFTTNYPANAPARISNIHLLADSLDGTIVAPGETFSFNETIGPRTAAKGYKEAPTIVGGKLIPTIGGGVCQVGSTIFNTAFFAGYPIVERSNHSFYISKYPVGRDATVSYGGKDFKFLNDTNAHVLIKTSHTATSITVAFYSADLGTKVSYTTSPRSNGRSYAEDITEDPTLPVGQRVVEEGGIGGFDVIVYRTVERGGKVVLEDKFFSRYRPKNAIVRVGVIPIAPPSPVQGAADPEGNI